MLNSNKLTDAEQLEICDLYAGGGWSSPRLAARFNCSGGLILKVIHAHGVEKGPSPPPSEEVHQARLKRRRELHHERYQNDPDYREKFRAKARQEDPVKRRARMNKRYAENEEYRRYIAEYGRKSRQAKNESQGEMNLCPS